MSRRDSRPEFRDRDERRFNGARDRDRRDIRDNRDGRDRDRDRDRRDVRDAPRREPIKVDREKVSCLNKLQKFPNTLKNSNKRSFICYIIKLNYLSNF